MKFHKGKNRYVLLLPSLGIVIKFPIVYLNTVLGALTKKRKEYGWDFVKIYLAAPMEASGFRSWLFKGLAENWMEFWLYAKTRNPFLQPTYFSLLGPFTIQRFGTPAPVEAVNLWCQLVALTHDQVWDDAHHFSNPENFTLDGGVLRIKDYGSGRTRKVVLLYGEKIVREFNPTYDWNVEQKKLK